MHCLTCVFIVLLFGAANCDFPWPKELILPIYYYDYAEWNAASSGPYSRSADDKKLIKDNLAYRATTDLGKMAAAACDFDICAVSGHLGECPGYATANYELGIVADELTKDGLPTHKIVNGARKEGLATKGLDFWYRNHSLNKGVHVNITLTKTTLTSATPIYRFHAQSDFHPLKNVVGTYYCTTKNGNGCSHLNYVFATHFKGFINYNSVSPQAKTIEIRSDDDSFLFIGGKLVNDWGGTRSPTTMTITLPDNKYVHGEKYQIDFFHADRCPTQSAFTIQGTFTCDEIFGDQTDTDGDGVIDCLDYCPDDKWKTKEIELKDNTGKVIKVCECQDTSDVCRLCSLIGPNMCSKAGEIGLTCDTCPTGECVDKGDCECASFTKQSTCDAYATKSDGKKCKWCNNNGQGSASCVPITQCECNAYGSNFDMCKNANSPFYKCRWCGNTCIDNSKSSEKQRCECTNTAIASTENLCHQTFELDFKTDSCAWCSYETGGYCDKTCNCDKFHGSGNSKKCETLKENKPSSQVAKCFTCTPDEAKPQNTYCLDNGSECSVCYEQKTKEDCDKSKYGDKSCLWCGGKCFADTTCPDDCEAYNSDGKTVCERATDGKANNSLGCHYCFENKCLKDVECPSCADISKNYCKAMAPFLSEDELALACETGDAALDYVDRVMMMQEYCISSVHKCHFCGKLEIDSSNTSDNPQLCVSDTEECPLCADIPSFDHKNFTDAERNCKSLNFVYSNYELPMPGDYGMQRCGYCEYTNTCVDLGTKIGEHQRLELEADQDAFVFKTFCDTNCHNYDNHKEGCAASEKNCGWCELPNGSSTCNSVNEECAHCAEYANDFLCVASGCTWCKNTEECISSNFNCSNPSAIAAGIGAGVVAAIVIGAIVALVIASFASKKMYDAIMDARAASMDTATSNPLFEDDASGGVNPAFAAE